LDIEATAKNSEDTYRQRILREYPPRPKIAITEDEIKKSETRSAIEGVWTDTEDHYRLGIVPAPAGSGADYVMVVLRSNSPVWQPSEIKAEFRSTASPDIFTCTYFMADKRGTGTTISLEHNAMLRGSVTTAKGPVDLLLMRVWPKVSAETAAVTVGAVSSGSGFLLSRSGLLATNWGSAKIRVNAATTDNRPLPTPSIRFNQRPTLHNPYLLPALR
jgi:hypothetical protein